MSSTRTASAAFWAALAVTACNRAATNGAPPQIPPTPVTLATAEARPIEETTDYVATLKSLRSTTIQPQIDGQITQILVKSGDRVRQGTPLMQIDSRRQQEVQLRYFTIAAPTTGVIGDVPVRVGHVVTPQTVLTTIEQNETLEVYV